MEFIGLILVCAAVPMVWWVTARPEVLKKLGRACFDGLYGAGKWYAEPYLDATGLPAGGDDVEPGDPAGDAETAMTDRLLRGSVTKADYHAAMAELARLDETRHPISMPPASDR